MPRDPDERTETEERIAENAQPAPRVTVRGKREEVDPYTGLTAGTHNDDSSPLDAGGLFDLFGRRKHKEKTTHR